MITENSELTWYQSQPKFFLQIISVLISFLCKNMSDTESAAGSVAAVAPVAVAQTLEKFVSPYYLHPSDNTGQVQTPILLNGSDYERWSKLMMNSLRTKQKLGFINGSLKRLSDNIDDAEKWDMVNAMIIGWIYSSVEPKLRPSISLVDSAKAMWAGL